MGVYLHDGGQVTLLPNCAMQLNGTSSVGLASWVPSSDNPQCFVGYRCTSSPNDN